MSSQHADNRRAVLLGAAGTGTAFALISRLRASWGQEVRIVSMDTNKRELVTASLLSDSFYNVPLSASAEFRDAVLQILKRERVTTYVPLVNDELLIASSLKLDVRCAGIDIVVPEDPAAEICFDKLKAYQWLTANGIPCPETRPAAELLGPGPWFLKPRNGFGSRGTCLVNRDSLSKMSKWQLDGAVGQSVCERPEVTVDFFFDAATGFKRSVCRERLEVKAGVCTKARLFHDPELERYGETICQRLSVRGAICFQVMKHNGCWQVTDLNIRPGAGTALTCAAGQDVLSAMFACRWGEPYEHFFTDRTLGDNFVVTRQYSEFVMHDS